MLGNIACGAPIFADGRVQSYMALSAAALRGKEHFIVTAQGDSMINIGINDGDMVLVEAANTADDGSVVATTSYMQFHQHFQFPQRKNRRFFLSLKMMPMKPERLITV